MLATTTSCLLCFICRSIVAATEALLIFNDSNIDLVINIIVGIRSMIATFIVVLINVCKWIIMDELWFHIWAVIDAFCCEMDIVFL
jgi:hypothetical protein